MIKYEWDKQKRQQNIEKHDTDFKNAEFLEWEYAVIQDDDRRDYGEPRKIAYAPIGNRLHCLVYTVRGDTIRIISFRKANRREVVEYEKA